ncbi:MAG: response regulator transcription factor [Phycisphaerales bacterium]|jgi:two-component system phosphate regulon response regulator PhoB|nr:response regulator transcription factor [Phycisphaerales bacterium]
MASPPSILIVEDEREIGELVKLQIEKAGYRARLVESGESALQHARGHAVDLIILDLMLPGIDGLEVCKRLQWEPSTRQIPVVILTARGEDADIVTGLELGAVDYIVKPFSAKVLVARVRNALRRGDDVTEPGNLEQQHGIEIDDDRFEIRVHGEAIDVTVSEFRILRYLASRPGFVRTRDQIIEATHGPRVVMSNRTIDVHITSLRRKLGPAGDLIETVRGVGYRLEDSGLATS